MITTGEDLGKVLVESPLAISEEGASRGEARPVSRGAAEAVDRPTVSIGIPDYWDVARFYADEGKPVPSLMRQHLDRRRYMLVRFACSLNPRGESHVTWARFAVSFSQGDDGNYPHVVDMHPLDTCETEKRDVRLTLSPTLKFSGVEASLGEAAADISYEKLIPLVTGLGLQEHDVQWDLEETDRHPLRGSRWFHAVLSIPATAGAVALSMSIDAEVETPKGFLRGTLRHSTTAEPRDWLIDLPDG